MNSPFIIITGMHRSGTSFLSRALNLSGLFLGSLDSIFSIGLEQSPDNPRGHWENKYLKDLADISLSHNSASWDMPPNRVEISADISEQLVKSISVLTSHPSLATGFKDPRLCILFDSWQKFLPQNLIMIGIFRHPLKVAESLKIRNNFSYEKSLELWKIYNVKLLKHLENTNGFLLNFDWEPKKLFDEINLISTKLGLINDIDFFQWFDKSLRRSDDTFTESYLIPEDITKIYETLKMYSEQNSSKQGIQNNYDPSEIIKGFSLELFSQQEYFQKLFITTIKDKDDFLNQVIKDNLEIQLRVLYMTILHREPDQLGLKNYLSKIQTGEISLDDAKNEIQNSDEAKNLKNTK